MPRLHCRHCLRCRVSASAGVHRLARIAQPARHRARHGRHRIAVRSAATIPPANGWAGSLPCQPDKARSEEHTSELQSLMRISYAVFCLKKKKTTQKEEHIVK